MDDNLNMKSSMIEAKNGDTGSWHFNKDFAFQVTDKVDTDDPWTVRGWIDIEDQPIWYMPAIGADVNCSTMMSTDRYVMRDDSQLRFIELPDYPCTERPMDGTMPEPGSVEIYNYIKQMGFASLVSGQIHSFSMNILEYVCHSALKIRLLCHTIVASPFRFLKLLQKFSFQMKRQPYFTVVASSNDIFCFMLQR
eukprot:scaffold2962_cov126-Cylindrotheca_fusiformis.AAC.18